MQTQGKFILFDNLNEFAAWLAATPINRRIWLIQNHHTFIPNYTSFTGANHFALLIGMENAHLERGFAEIAQNLTTFPDGKIAICRSLDKIPAGIKGANTGGVCIENLGNFDRNRDPVTAAQSVLRTPGHSQSITREAGGMGQGNEPEQASFQRQMMFFNAQQRNFALVIESGELTLKRRATLRFKACRLGYPDSNEVVKRME